MNLTANEKNAAAARQRRYVLLLAVMLVLLFIIIVLSFWVGYYPLTPVQVLNAFLSKFGFKGDILPQAVTIFWNIRLPRILSAFIYWCFPLGSRCNLSGNVSQSTGISGYPWSFFRCKSRSCFCNFKRSFQLDDSTFCFCRWCSRSSRILSYQPKNPHIPRLSVLF